MASTNLLSCWDSLVLPHMAHINVPLLFRRLLKIYCCLAFTLPVVSCCCPGLICVDVLPENKLFLLILMVWWRGGDCGFILCLLSCSSLRHFLIFRWRYFNIGVPFDAACMYIYVPLDYHCYAVPDCQANAKSYEVDWLLTNKSSLHRNWGLFWAWCLWETGFFEKLKWKRSNFNTYLTGRLSSRARVQRGAWCLFNY